MERFLYRVEYIFPDATHSYESVCVRAADDDVVAAHAEVMVATNRYATWMQATRVLTLVAQTADV